MASIRVSGVQMRPTDSVHDNVEEMLKHIATTDTDIVLFPLRSLTGSVKSVEASTLEKAYETISAAARAHYTTVIFNTVAVEDNENFIQSRIYSDSGDLVGTQEKLVPTEVDRDWCTPGGELRLFQKNGFSYGCLCGNDFWVAPGMGSSIDRRLSYQLGERGARILFHSVDSGTDERYREYYESNLKLRAWESKCFVFTANAAPESGELNAPTGVISPQGVIVHECSRSGEQVYHYDLDLDELL